MIHHASFRSTSWINLIAVVVSIVLWPIQAQASCCCKRRMITETVTQTLTGLLSRSANQRDQDNDGPRGCCGPVVTEAAPAVGGSCCQSSQVPACCGPPAKLAPKDPAAGSIALKNADSAVPRLSGRNSDCRCGTDCGGQRPVPRAVAATKSADLESLEVTFRSFPGWIDSPLQPVPKTADIEPTRIDFLTPRDRCALICCWLK